MAKPGFIPPKEAVYELAGPVFIRIKPGLVAIGINDNKGEGHELPLDPALAPIFRMVSNRLEEIAKAREAGN